MTAALFQAWDPVTIVARGNYSIAASGATKVGNEWAKHNTDRITAFHGPKHISRCSLIFNCKLHCQEGCKVINFSSVGSFSSDNLIVFRSVSVDSSAKSGLVTVVSVVSGLTIGWQKCWRRVTGLVAALPAT